jgi:hypothetical protein
MRANRFRTSCLLLLCLCGCCNSQPVTTKGSAVEFSEIYFLLPAGVVDNTSYAFRSGEGDFRLQEWLAFDQDQLPPGVHDLDGLAEYRVAELRAASASPITITANAPSRFGPLAGRLLTVVQSSGSLSLGINYLLVILPDGTYEQLAYKTRPDDTDGITRLEYIAGSIRPFALKPDGGKAGFTRRRLGRVTMEVPSHLRPPSQYIFSIPVEDGSIKLVIWRPGDSDPPASLSSLMAQDAAIAGTLGPSFSDTLNAEGGTASVLRYTITRREYDVSKEIAVNRGRLKFASGVIASVTALSSVKLEMQTERIFRTFLQSLGERR